MTDRDIARSVEIPFWFLSEVAPQIRDISELQVMLAYFRALSSAESLSTPVPVATLVHDELLNQALRLEGAVRSPDESIRRGIGLAVARETVLQFSVESAGQETAEWLLLATPENRIRLERFRSGAISPSVLSTNLPAESRVERTRPGIFARYEQNIGLVTPIIADRLVEALELYPEAWIEEAIEAAVSYNRRNWRYIQRILETWATEGRSNETYRRHQSDSGDFDPERHLTGEYAAIFKRRRRE